MAEQIPLASVESVRGTFAWAMAVVGGIPKSDAEKVFDRCLAEVRREAEAAFITRALTDECMDPAVAEVAAHPAVAEGDAFDYAWNAVRAALEAATAPREDEHHD